MLTGILVAVNQAVQARGITSDPWPELPSNRSKIGKTETCLILERVTEIESVSQPWEGRVLPLNHTRITA